MCLKPLHYTGEKGKKPIKQSYCTTQEIFWTCGVYSVYSGFHTDLGLQNHMKLDAEIHPQKLHDQISSSLDEVS